MRRSVAIALVAVGTALLVLGLGLKQWAYPRLATVPLDQQSTTESVGENMSVLVIRAEGVRVLDGATVTSERRVVGNVGAVPRDNDTDAFWETTVQSSADGVGVLSQSREGVSFDRFTGTSTNCCGDYVSVATLGESGVTTVNEPIQHKGLFFKFPFDTQRQDYPFWDGDLKDTADAAYAGTEDVKGLRTYKFVQRIPDTTLETRQVPGSLFQGAPAGNVDADLVYANTRTLWVEPHTGVIVKGQEEVNKRLVWNGQEAAATRGTIGYTDETVSNTVDAYGSKSVALGLIAGNLPVLVAVFGGLMLLGGLVLAGASARSGGGRRVLDAGDLPDTVDLRSASPRERDRG